MKILSPITENQDIVDKEYVDSHSGGDNSVKVIDMADLSDLTAAHSYFDGIVVDEEITPTFLNNYGYLSKLSEVSYYTDPETNVRYTNYSFEEVYDYYQSTVFAKLTFKVPTDTTYPVLIDTGEKVLQEQLVSGTSIKTINNQSLLGSGNISISGGSNDFSNQLSDYYVSDSYFAIRKKHYPTDPSYAVQGCCMIDNPNTASGAPERVMLVYKVQTTGTDANKAGYFYIYDPQTKTVISEVSVTGNTIDTANYHNFNNGVTSYETGDVVYYDHVNSLAYNPVTKKCFAFAYFYSGRERYTSGSSYGSRFYEFNITYSNGHYNFEIESVVDTKGSVSSCAYNDKRDLYILCSTGGMWMELKPDFSEITEVDKRNDLNPFWSKAQATARGLTKRTLTQGITYYNGYYYWGFGMTPLTETKALESLICVLDENYEVVKNIKVLDGTELEQVCFGDSLRETYLAFNGSACKIRHGSIYMGDQETMPNLYNENFILSRNGDGSVLNNATSEECSTGIFYIDLLAGATISNGEVTEYQNVWCDGTSTNPYNDFNMIYELISSSYNRIRIYLANTTTSNILKLNGIQKWIHIIGQGSNDIYPKLGRLNVCNCQNVRIERLDIENNGTVTSKAVTISGSNVIINDCYTKSTGYNYYIQANSSVYSQSTVRTYGLKLEHTGANTEAFIFVATGSKAFFVPSSAQFIESGSTSAESYVTCTGSNCSGNDAFINAITGHMKTRNNIDINDVNTLNTPV